MDLDPIAKNGDSPMHIVIPDDYQNSVRGLAAYAKLAGHTVEVFQDSVSDTDALAARFAQADAMVLIRERTVIGDALLARLPRLRLISQTGRGTSHIDVDACTRRGIVVCAGTGSPHAPAELTWALVLAAMRRIPQNVASMQAGNWQSGLGRSVRGRTLGIWGYGKIGSLVAGFGRAMGMQVLIWGRGGSLQRAQADGYVVAASRETLLEAADVLSLHIRLSNETTGMVKATDLARMRPDALLVNTSRAELIEPGALLAALQAGRPGMAALDVYEREPVDISKEALLKMDRVLCTPHLGYVEQDSYELYFDQAFDNIMAFASGKPANVVNPAALDA
jgi:D-3-phosphoglycerate dehydrogenase